MIKKNIIISILYLFLISNFAFADDYNDDIQNNQIEEYIEEQTDTIEHNKKKKKKHKKKNKTKKNKKKDKKGFFKTYIFPNENQIFGKKKHLISLFGGYSGEQSSLVNWISSKMYHGISIYECIGNEISCPSDLAKRRSFNFSLSYSIPLKIFFINGRLTIGIFGMYIKQNIFRDDYWWFIKPRVQGEAIMFVEDKNNQKTVNGIFKTYTIGVESMYELIFGHKNLYLTFGAGVSYMFILSQNAKTDNENFNELWEYRNPKILWNNSLFNWVIKASIGHKFDCGLVIEVNWKHYSNGELSEYNWGFNFFGGTIGYVF